MGEKSSKDIQHQTDVLMDEVGRLKNENAELQKTQQQFDAIFNQPALMIFFKDMEGRYTKVNNCFEQNFGVTSDEIIGKLPGRIQDPEAAEKWRQRDQSVLLQGITERIESEVEFSDQTVHTTLALKMPLYNTNNQINGMAAIVTDITEQKLAESRYRGLVETVDCIVWEVDLETFDFCYVNHYAEELLGYTIEEWYQPGFWSEIMHPDDRSWAFQYCQDCIDENLETYEFDYRVISKDGRVVWLHDIVSLVVENDKPRWLRGIMVDITAKKTMESEMASIQARFHTIFDTAPVGMLLVSGETHEILEMNEAYCQIVGRSPEQVLEEGWKSYTHPDDYPSEAIQMNRLSSGETDRYDLIKRFYQSDGSLVWVQSRAIAIDTPGDADSFQYLIVLEDITERKKSEERIWRQANYDFLTNLPNRQMIEDRIEQLIKESLRSSQQFSILMIDLDGFKDVNDTLGHKKGDDLLIEAGQRIKNCIRESDTVGRLGGDEFVVILSHLTHISGVEQVADNINKSLANVFNVTETELFVSASIGIASFPEDANDVLGLLKNADQAMYRAKQQGRNHYQFFTQSLQDAAIDRMMLINDLRIAIAEQNFELHYQPIVDIRSGKLCKAEALIRWNHPDRGRVGPDDFIPVAEETQLIIDIGDWVFKESVDRLKQWSGAFGDSFQININVSPSQFKRGLDQDWIQYMKNNRVPEPRLGIEITETLFMTSDDHTIRTLLEFRNAGVSISLDDFGTGYSSLSYLKKFDIDFLKIDRSFVKNLKPESNDLALCSAIVMMAHQLGIKVIAEGIETSEQRELLIGIGCDYGQGYFFSRPINASEFGKRYLGIAESS